MSRTYDHSERLVPYHSRTRGGQEWRSVASRKWSELGLPQAPAPESDWEPCYVRWGDCPAGGRSFNHELGEYENGVAVFRAYKTPDNECLLDLQHSVVGVRDPLLGILYVRLSTSGRRLYRVYGTPCATGGGG